MYRLPLEEVKGLIQCIIVCLVTDDIWNDQSLMLDSDLPPGWRTIRDSSGTYYWHVPSGTTQWQHPSYSTEDEQSISSGLPVNQLKVNEVTLTCLGVCKEETMTRPKSLDGSINPSNTHMHLSSYV